MNTVPKHSILVLSANLQIRALLTGQLSETSGCDVVSAAGVDEALALQTAGIHPLLLVVDAGPQMTHKDVERLIVALPDTPLVLIAGALRRVAFDPLREHCAAYLVRPVSIGRIAQSVVQVIESSLSGQ